MNKAFETITAFIGDITDLLKGLVVLGIVVGILSVSYTHLTLPTTPYV